MADSIHFFPAFFGPIGFLIGAAFIPCGENYLVIIFMIAAVMFMGLIGS